MKTVAKQLGENIYKSEVYIGQISYVSATSEYMESVMKTEEKLFCSEWKDWQPH